MMPLTMLAPIAVRNVHELNSLAFQTYVLAAIVGAICLLIAGVAANAIRFEGGANPSDPGKRRLAFWLLLVVAFVGFFLYNFLAVEPTVAANLQARFTRANLIGCGIAVGVYFLVGFGLSKAFPRGKLGNWFPAGR